MSPPTERYRPDWSSPDPAAKHCRSEIVCILFTTEATPDERAKHLLAVAHGNHRDETFFIPIASKKAGHARRSQSGFPIKQAIYIGHYPIDAYAEADDYLRDKPSPHSLYYGNGTSGAYMTTAITGIANSDLIPMLGSLLTATPPESLQRIVDIIPMALPQTGATRYYATSLPTPYLYTIWAGPPGQIGLSKQYNSELITLDAPPQVTRLSGKTWDHPPSSLPTTFPRVYTHQPATHYDCTTERGRSRRKAR